MKKQPLMALLPASFLVILLVMAFSTGAQGRAPIEPLHVGAASQRVFVRPDGDITAEFDAIPSPQYVNQSFQIAVTLRRENGDIFPYDGQIELGCGAGASSYCSLEPEEPYLDFENGQSNATVTIASMPSVPDDVYLQIGEWVSWGGGNYFVQGESNHFEVVGVTPTPTLAPLILEASAPGSLNLT